jgi:hypothetical protein
MSALYSLVAEALDVGLDDLNLEGSCILGDRLRWYHRGLPSASLPSGSVDLDLASVLAVVRGDAGPTSVVVSDVRSYDLGSTDGVALAITDAAALPGGRVLCSAAAEDSPNVRDDGPVVGSALVLLDDEVLDVAVLPSVDGRVAKVEGLTLLEATGGACRLLAVVDADDPDHPSLALTLAVVV